MHIVSCQFNPLFKEPERNRAYATQLLADLQPEHVDILLLPEMAFTGCNTGPSVQWAQQQARRLHCFVIVGYPERVNMPDGSPIYYNSACIVDRQGQLVHTYRKAYLYTTDLNWACWSDTGFTTVLLDGIGEVGIGICMDLNSDLRADNFYDMPFGCYMQEKQVKLVLVLMNWISSNPQLYTSKDEPALDQIYYWCTRLSPLMQPVSSSHDNDTIESNATSHKIHVITCNRTAIIA
ncbi:carbon-nitrogen hydrolase [Syncephalis plumigaleata]|nr:carbon-nitrogen hydrolase [Syncephalis plumigaleata]